MRARAWSLAWRLRVKRGQTPAWLIKQHCASRTHPHPLPFPEGSKDSAVGAEREGEGEAGALAGGAVDGDVAGHEAGQAAGDVEAEAGAAGLGRVDALEAVEDPFLVLRGDALALVGDD